MPSVIGGRYGLSSKEFTPGMVAGVFEELGRERPKRRFTIGINDDVSQHEPALRRRRSTSSPRRPCARCSSAWAPTGRSARTRTRSRSSATRRACTPRATSSTTPRSPARRPSRTCASGPEPIRAPVPRLAGELRRLPPVRAARARRGARAGGAGRDAAAQLPRMPPDRVWDALVAPGAGADPRQADRAVRDRRGADRARGGPRPGGPTRCCRRASSRSRACSSASRRSSGSRRRSPKTYGKRGAEVVERNQTAVDRSLGAPAPGRAARAGHVRARAGADSCPRDAPEFVRTVTAAMMAGRGDELPVSALPVDGTYPSGTTQYEKRNISDFVAVWDSELCIQCGNCSFVCPHSVIRSRYYEPVPPGRRAGRLPVGSAQRSRPSGRPATRCRSTSRTAPAAGCASRPVRSRRPETPARKAINLDARSSRCWPPSARTSRSSSSCRQATARGSTSAPCAAPSSWSRCSSSPAPAPAAARRRT